MLRKLTYIAIAFLALPLSGCWEYNLFSWSPDGRYLVFIDSSDGMAWRWDTVKQRPERITSLDRAEINKFAFLSGHEAIVFGKGFNAPSFFAQASQGLIKLNLRDSYFHEVPPGTATEDFALTRDGSQVVTIGRLEDPESNTRYVVAIAPTNDVNKQRELTTFEAPILMPHLDDTGTRLLVVKELSSDDLPEGVEEGAELVLIDFTSDAVTTTTLLQTRDEFPINPRWIGGDRFVYTLFQSNEENLFKGKLMLRELNQDEPELLHDRAVGFYIPSISPDGNTLVCTTALDDILDVDEITQSGVQLMGIDLTSRDTTILTQEAFGAYAGAFHPTKNQLAYATGEEPYSVRILDLDTGKRQLVWRDEEERVFVGAERFKDSGDTGLASAAYEELLRRFPESDFGARALFRKMELDLESPIDAFSEAVDAFTSLLNSGLRVQARPKLWAQPDAMATDPRDDLIRKYATDASNSEFDFNTDRTRDLTSLDVRTSSTDLYLRIGFDSAYDLGGSVFQDVVLLFHEVGSDREFVPTSRFINWEFPAASTVIIRHWDERGQVYDFEALNESGASIVRYASSGFAPPAFPVFGVIDLDEYPDGGTIAYRIDHRALGLLPEKEYYLQVCTMKGGIESYKALERARETSGWDIADAFGDSNTKERIDAEIADATTPKLLGYATTIRIPSEEENL